MRELEQPDCMHIHSSFNCCMISYILHSEDVQKKGFTIIVDARGEKWTNFKSILQVIKVGLFYCCLKCLNQIPI